MIDWLFGRRKKTAPPQPEGVREDGEIAPAQRAAPAPAQPAVDWQARLAQAAGDDDALLALAQGAAPVEVKLAAVGSLTTEPALKRAERELRKYDRRVHRLAKQRHAELLATGAARLQAAQLTASARALLDAPLIAANRLVELDRAWRALDARLLDGSQAADFAALFEQLSALVRERTDHALEAGRFDAAGRAATAGLQSACEQAAAGTIDRAALAAASAQARSVLDAAPAGADAGSAACEALRAALHTADELAPRLAALDALSQKTPSAEAQTPPAVELEAPIDDSAPIAPAPAAASQTDALRRWHAFAPLADANLARLLAQRFSQWQQAQARAVARQPKAAPLAATVDDAARVERLERSVERAQAALAEGSLGEAGKALAAIDAAARDGSVPAALRASIDELHAEFGRLRGWQHWGGGRARDELVAQAEALAAADAGSEDADLARMTTRQRVELINELRARWKELDRHGGASNRTLWQRFDAALNTAHAPVAAQAQARREARAHNLQTRIELLAALEAVALPGGAEAAAASGEPGSDAEPDARAPTARLGAALAEFQAAWRKLGPLEHTVPHAEREALQARMSAAVARVQAPLDAARRVAQAQREDLIAQARALTAAGTAPGRDGLDKARALQARWQEAAKALPLARAAEGALWTEFRAAIDAVYGARQAEAAARDAEFKARIDEREALIARLAAFAEGVGNGASDESMARTLVEVDAAWRQAGAAPRVEAAALDTRYRSARDAVRARLADAAQRRWRAQCDLLAARLDERDGIEAGGAAGVEPLALPARWERALARENDTAPADPLSDDDLLLQLEAALGIASPPAFEAARRALKLQAMKAALEARTPNAAPLAADDLLVAALARETFDTAQRTRLRAAIAALRDAAPSTP